MKLSREIELRRLLEHERKMAQHPRKLFPKDERIARILKCRGCMKTFMIHPNKGGKPRAFCTGDCKLAYYRGKSGPLPAMTAGGQGRVGDALPDARRGAG